MKRFVLVVFGLCFCLSAIAQVDTVVNLIARTVGTHTMHDGYSGKVFGFVTEIINPPIIPSPTIYVTEGDSVEIDFWNFSQGAPHTIHLHGLDVNQENDGVPALSFVVEHMDHGYYKFKAPHPGTYLYHCHVLSSIHVQAGMYGMLVVLPASGNKVAWDSGPEYDKAFNFLFSEFDKEWHVDSIMHQYHNPGQIMQWAYLPKYEPEYFLVNGNSAPADSVDGETINTQAKAENLVRFANVGFYGVEVLIPTSLNPRLISSDGRPLPSVIDGSSLFIMPGERYSVLLKSDSQLQANLSITYRDLNVLEPRASQVIPFSARGYLGQEVLGITKLKAFPNPAKDLLTLEFTSAKAQRVMLKAFNLQGQQVASFESQINKGIQQLTLPVDKLSKGNYILQILTEEGNSKSIYFSVAGSF